MNLSELLNSDMTTLSRLARQGLDWWLRELSALLPAGMVAGRRLAAFHRLGTDDTIIAATTRGVDTLVIAREACLVRNLALPAMAEADLAAMVELDADRLLPLAAQALIINVRRGQPTDDGTRVHVVVGALARARAERIAAALAAAGIAPRHVGPLDEQGERLAFDLAPAMRRAGLLPARPPVLRFWWSVVAVLVLVNVGVAILRDQRQVARVQELVDAQAPALNAVRRIEDRLRANAGSIGALRARRERQQPLRTLARLGAALPAQSWVQRLEWDGTQIRVSGYAADGVNAVSAVKQSGAFTQVRASRSEALAETASGRPFDFSAAIKGQP